MEGFIDRTELLRELINNTGLSMRAFSEKAGIPNTTLYSILERGMGKASVDNVIKVCKALGITVEQLQEMADTDSLVPVETKEPKDENIDTIAAHFKGKNITPKKMKLIEQYIDALFDDEE